MKRALVLFGLSAILLIAGIALLPSPAVATVDGPCTASIADVDVTSGHDRPSEAVSLEAGTRVGVAGTAEGRVRDLAYTVHVAGGAIQVGSVTIGVDGRTWSGTVDLENFSKVGVGLFEVTLDVQTDAGNCAGVVYVCVEGASPFATATGAGATALAMGGGILLVVSLVKADAMGAVRAPLQGFAGGATAGLGGAVLLQAFCVLPLSASSLVGISIAAGVVGAIGASLLQRAGSRRRGRVARPPTLPEGATGEPTEVLERRSHDAREPGDRTRGASEPVDTGYGASGPIPPPPSPAAGLLPPAPPPNGEGILACPTCGSGNAWENRFCTTCGVRLQT